MSDFLSARGKKQKRYGRLEKFSKKEVFKQCVPRETIIFCIGTAPVSFRMNGQTFQLLKIQRHLTLKVTFLAWNLLGSQFGSKYGLSCFLQSG